MKSETKVENWNSEMKRRQAKHKEERDKQRQKTTVFLLQCSRKYAKFHIENEIQRRVERWSACVEKITPLTLSHAIMSPITFKLPSPLNPPQSVCRCRVELPPGCTSPLTQWIKLTSDWRSGTQRAASALQQWQVLCAYLGQGRWFWTLRNLFYFHVQRVWAQQVYPSPQTGGLQGPRLRGEQWRGWAVCRWWWWWWWWKMRRKK